MGGIVWCRPFHLNERSDNNLAEEKRMAGDYEIIQAFHIGDREVVLGVNLNAAPDERYMCSLGEKNDVLEFRNDVMVSDDYTEIVQLFGQRIIDQAKKVQQELFKPSFQGIDNEPITECNRITYKDDLHNRVAVIKPDVLRREYQHATHQLVLVTGGFGASPNSRGSACFCVNLYTGESGRYERQDILGTLNEDQLPKWAQHGLDMYRNKQKTERSDR